MSLARLSTLDVSPSFTLQILQVQKNTSSLMPPRPLKRHRTFSPPVLEPLGGCFLQENLYTTNLKSCSFFENDDIIVNNNNRSTLTICNPALLPPPRLLRCYAIAGKWMEVRQLTLGSLHMSWQSSTLPYGRETRDGGGLAGSILLNAPPGAFQNMHCTLTSIEPAVVVSFSLFLTPYSLPLEAKRTVWQIE